MRRCPPPERRASLMRRGKGAHQHQPRGRGCDQSMKSHLPSRTAANNALNRQRAIEYCQMASSIWASLITGTNHPTRGSSRNRAYLCRHVFSGPSVAVAAGDWGIGPTASMQHDDAQPRTPCRSTSQNGFQPPSGLKQRPTKPVVPTGILAISCWFGLGPLRRERERNPSDAFATRN